MWLQRKLGALYALLCLHIIVSYCLWRSFRITKTTRPVQSLELDGSESVKIVIDVTSRSYVTERLDPVGGAGRPMEAWGRVVKPRANVTAPWSRDNTSTLCPLVPPNLGEIGTYF